MDASAQEWVAEALAQHGLSATGPLEVVKRRPWATVLRAPTSSGAVYFKANAPGGRHEPALARELARAWPDRVPAPLAADPERGWMLTLDHGRRLTDAVPGDRLLATWEELLPRYAEIQLAAAEAPERWLALGVPDRRLERLPAAAEALVLGSADLADEERARMLALLPELETVCGELASLPVATSLEHGDLHGNNVLVGRGAHWFFDWADSSVSHPFFSLLITCNMLVEDLDSETGRRTRARLCDAYLEPWAAVAPARELLRFFPLALWVAHLGRALDWEHMLAGGDALGRDEWHGHVATWLRHWLARRSWAGLPSQRSSA
jgi:hypothetical protein